MVEKEELSTKSTRIDNSWHCRLLREKEVLAEMSCEDKRDISYCFREMLRWYDKLGGSSKMASASRHRQKGGHPKGVIKRFNAVELCRKIKL